MLSLAKGYDSNYLTGAVGGGREGYYTGAVVAGEPAGLWYGQGAAVLGLTGQVDAELMAAVYGALLDPRDPAAHNRVTWGEAQLLSAAHRVYRSAEDIYRDLLAKEPGADPVRRSELQTQAERSARQAVSFYDATFSAPKSVSVLGVAFERMANDARAAGDEQAAEAWSTLQKAVEDAVLAGARAAVDYLQDTAGYSRVGDHGGAGGRWTDAHTFVVAQFLQHDSRDRDPQLHVHNAILNRVLCPDGTWRAIDATTLFAHKPAAGAVGERVMEAHLARALGVLVTTRADGKAREVVGVSQEIRDLYSSRRHAITPKIQELESAFRERNGREPSPLERHYIAQQATLATRRAKAHDGETLEERLDRWTAQAHTAMLGGLAQVARDALSFTQSIGPPEKWSERDVIERALATVGRSRQKWSRSDLTKAISDELPGHLGVAPEEIRDLLDGLTTAAIAHATRLTPVESIEHLPREALLANGESSFARPGDVMYATDGQLAAEKALRGASAGRGAAAFTSDEADRVIGRFTESGRELGADQRAALRGVLTSGARIEVLCAAAGTGKSFVVGALAEAWQESGRRVFGLAPSQVATSVLAEDGVTARNVTAWLTTQQRIDEHRTLDGDETFRLCPGDVIVVDEASMIATGDLAEVHRRCDAADAKLLLVGDPRQLGAVGPGGALTDLAERGLRYELTEVRRFSSQWERTASLRLRAGDVAVLNDYVRHGRLVDGGTAEQAEAAAARAWLADTLAGRESLLVVPTNRAADRVSASLRDELIRLGKVEEAGVELGLQGTYAGVGDLVQAHRNGWELIGFEGNARAPINRETYRVVGLREDDGLTVAPIHDRVNGTEVLGDPLQLPREYVAEHVALGYASTVHAAEGRTVDTAHGVVGPGMDAASVYVMSTRGRDGNTLWTVTTNVPADAETGQAHEATTRSARAVLAGILETARPDQSALTEREEAERDARSVMRHGDRMIERAKEVTAGRTSMLLDVLAADGLLTAQDRAALAADNTSWSLERLLRTAELAGHDPAEVLTEAVIERDLDDARHPAQVIYARIENRLHNQLNPKVTSYADLIPREVPEDWREWFTARAEAADDRRRQLGEQVVKQVPQWAAQALGAPPEDPIARAEWEHRAGWAASYRELTGHTDDTDALGPAPPAAVVEKHALWRAAHAALDLPDTGADERAATDGQLRVRVRAWERERAWAPRWVADQLAATNQAADRARVDATVWSARADVAADPAEARALKAEALAAQAKAEELAQRAAELHAADETQARWYAHTAVTRDAAVRARAELGNRGVDLDDPAEKVTAQEWLELHRQDTAAEDLHRQVTDEAELTDAGWEQVRAEADRLAAVDNADGAETAVPDIREVAVADPAEYDDPDERHRLRSADEAAAAVTRAHTALAEIEARRQYDDAQAAEEAQEAARREELNRWAEQDRVEQAEAERDDELAMEC